MRRKALSKLLVKPLISASKRRSEGRKRPSLNASASHIFLIRFRIDHKWRPCWWSAREELENESAEGKSILSSSGLVISCIVALFASKHGTKAKKIISIGLSRKLTCQHFHVPCDNQILWFLHIYYFCLIIIWRLYTQHLQLGLLMSSLFNRSSEFHVVYQTKA